MLIPLVRSLRPHQWAKNSFVLAPLVFARALGEGTAIERALLAFAAFCAISSAVYLVNDLRDRDADRRHPLKKHRPLAAGTLSPSLAIVTALGLAATSAALAHHLGTRVLVVIAVYVALNLLYSTVLKHVVILDVMIVAVGFVLRVLAGGAAIGVAVSSWLVLCTIFLALFLAFSKRRHEIVLLAQDAADQRKVLSSYSPAFLDQMINVVSASSVVCYALYAIAPQTTEKYHTEHLVYTIPLVLFGIFRYLYLMYQAKDAKSPTDAILSDAPFLVNMGLWAAAVLWIVYGL
jgi:4-hydroxybenzoate polyprenyltransferase